jgi:hypothetical protein
MTILEGILIFLLFCAVMVSKNEKGNGKQFRNKEKSRKIKYSPCREE